jgi:GPI-GlcNAc transferase complex, PIG-H component
MFLFSWFLPLSVCTSSSIQCSIAGWAVYLCHCLPTYISRCLNCFRYVFCIYRYSILNQCFCFVIFTSSTICISMYHSCCVTIQSYTESMIAVQGLGIQLCKTSMFGTKRNRFFHTSDIKELIINEGITMCRVVFYLALITNGSRRLVLPFAHHQPSRDASLCVLGEAQRLGWGKQNQ